MSKVTGLFASLFVLAGLFGGPAWAYDPNKVTVANDKIPRELEGIGIDEKLSDALDLSLPFVSETGEKVTLAKYFTGSKPVLLSIVYYNCANLCNFHLNGVTDALKEIKWTAGQEFELVAVSMDSREGPDVAGPKKANYLKVYDRPGAEKGWHFLTGSEASVKALANAVGFHYRWDEESKQFAHSSAAVIVTPKGIISRYIHGIQPQAKDLKLALIEAADGRVGTVMDRLVMFCFKFDPKKSKYTIAAWRLMQAGVLLTVLIAAMILVPLWARERRHQDSA